MSGSNRPPSRPASRTPSIPIPSAARSIEDILNINALGSPPATPIRVADPRTERRQSHSFARPAYSGIEASRPTSGMRHASTSSSVGSSRPALLGGSGPPWGARSASVSTAPVLPGSFGMQGAIATFEPRVIGGSGGASAERNGTFSRQDSLPSTSPTRRLGRMSTQGRIRSRAPHHIPTVVSTGNVPYAHHLGNGPPTSFMRPSYLRYSSLRDLLQTDVDASSNAPRPVPALASGRDVTPFTESDDDSESSGGFTGRPYARRERGRARGRSNAFNASLPLANLDPMINLPSRWNDQDKHKNLQVSEDGRNLSFNGPATQGEKEAAAARANHPIPPACGIYYYEVTILDKGYKGHISVGFSYAGVRLSRLPGWEKNSWGYHGDDGHSFASERDGTPFGPRFSTGDVIGCGIDFSLNTAFYTKNSSLLGYVFDNIGKDESIYPSVGLRTPQEHVRINFGQEPFKYDIDYHVHCARDRAWGRIQATPVKWSIDDSRDIFELEEDKAARKNASPEVKQELAGEDFTPIELPQDYSEPINKLVLTYLQHHGYESTANALKIQMETRRKKSGATGRQMVSKKEEMEIDIKMEMDDSLPENGADGPFDLSRLGQESDPNAEAMRTRQRVAGAVLSGDIDLVLRLTQELFPSVLDADGGFLLLKLKCRKFVELILYASDASQAMKKAQADGVSSWEEPIGSTGEGAMDVDEDPPQSPANGKTPVSSIPPAPLSPRMKRGSSRSVASKAVATYSAALTEAITYGKMLHAEMAEMGARPDAHALLKTTFSLVTYDDPRVAGGEVQALTSQEARAKLAQEVNQAILESQGRPSRPALERLYRQTSATLAQLALFGVGDAAFADIRREFLDG